MKNNKNSPIKLINSSHDIFPVANGFILKPVNNDYGMISKEQTFVFSNVKELAKFIETRFIPIGEKN